MVLMVEVRKWTSCSNLESFGLLIEEIADSAMVCFRSWMSKWSRLAGHADWTPQIDQHTYWNTVSARSLENMPEIELAAVMCPADRNLWSIASHALASMTSTYSSLALQAVSQVSVESGFVRQALG